VKSKDSIIYDLIKLSQKLIAYLASYGIDVSEFEEKLETIDKDIPR